MNAFELLKADHRKVEDIFAKLEETTERAVKTREELFLKLKTELEIHTQIEEEILYPVLKEAADTREITFEAYEEHNVAKQLLLEMEGLPVDSEEWMAKCKVLQENIEHHVEEEEEEMFKMAEEVLTTEQIEEIGTQLQAEKKELAASAKA